MTDLHFAKDDSENEVREKWDYIKEMIQNKLSDKKVDVIAVTGVQHNKCGSGLM